MKLALVALLLFVVVFAETVVIDYPVFIVRLDNSTRAVVPWDVEDVHGFTSEVKNPVPGEYLLIGRRERWRLGDDIRNVLQEKGFDLWSILTTTSSGFQAGVTVVGNVEDTSKLLAILREDPEFGNIMPVDVSDKIDEYIWHNKHLIYRHEDSTEFGIRIGFKVRNVLSLSAEEIEQIREILKGFDCVHERCHESDIGRWGIPPVFATLEQVTELVKNPFVRFVHTDFLPITHMESVRHLTGVDVLQQNLQNTFEWITPFVGWLEDSLYGRVGIHTGAGITVSINEHPINY